MAGDWISRASSIILFPAALAYCIGFGVVNSHLYRYGMVPYDFLQPRFLSAGILYLGATVGPTAFVMYLHHVFGLAHSSKRAAESATGVAIILTALGISGSLPWLWPKSPKLSPAEGLLAWPSLALLVGLLAMSLITSEAFKKSKLSTFWENQILERGIFKYVALIAVSIERISTGGVASFSFFVVFVISLLFWLSVFRSQKHIGLALSDNIHAAIAALGAIGLSVYLYANYTYPLVSPHIGGGKPLVISLALKAESQHVVGRMMGREHPACVLHNISLLHENSDFLYVLANGYTMNSSAIGIPKSEIVSISYQDKPLSDTHTCF